MKVYIPPPFSTSSIKLNKIKKYLTKKTTTNYIVTPQGLFQVYKNKIMCLEIVDVPCKEFKIDDVNFIIDYSKTKFGDECVQLPLEHHVEEITSYEYSLRPGGQVHFIVDVFNNDTVDVKDEAQIKEAQIKEVYFLANDDINSQILNDDIISFLLELNFC